jgi:hypothetical protein
VSQPEAGRRARKQARGRAHGRTGERVGGQASARSDTDGRAQAGGFSDTGEDVDAQAAGERARRERACTQAGAGGGATLEEVRGEAMKEDGGACAAQCVEVLIKPAGTRRPGRAGCRVIRLPSLCRAPHRPLRHGSDTVRRNYGYGSIRYGPYSKSGTVHGRAPYTAVTAHTALLYGANGHWHAFTSVLCNLKQFPTTWGSAHSLMWRTVLHKHAGVAVELRSASCADACHDLGQSYNRLGALRWTTENYLGETQDQVKNTLVLVPEGVLSLIHLTKPRLITLDPGRLQPSPPFFFASKCIYANLYDSMNTRVSTDTWMDEEGR